MFFSNKKEELEFENSDRKIFGNDSDFQQNYAEKMSESEIGVAWPFVPLMNFQKEAYKNDNIYLANKSGDDPPEDIASVDTLKEGQLFGKRN